ncbi:MAG: hypothetical protein AMXMBFR13_39240 [Phycisphaerae bacterium]
MPTGFMGLLLGLAWAAEPPAGQREGWTFDPNTLKLVSPRVSGLLRPVGDMHGLVIEKLGENGLSPVAGGRAFLNLEHYLEAGRWAEYLPRKLDHSVCMDRRHLSISFPQPEQWAVTSKLTYTWERPAAVDAKLEFDFTGAMKQFEVYFTSYFAPQYERSIRVDGKWMRPEISKSEQLLVPRDEQIAARYGDGRWDFLKGRTRLTDYTFDLPVMVSRDDATGWTIVQMIEPGLCTHIAPNRFAVGHNFIIGGWDVKSGDRRSARIRLIAGQKLTDADVEREFVQFAAECGKADSDK